MSKPDGGPAFPLIKKENGYYADIQQFSCGMSLRQYFAIHSPEPSDEVIKVEMQIDRTRDPHNDRGLIRNRLEIIAALRYRYADAMIAEDEK